MTGRHSKAILLMTLSATLVRSHFCQPPILPLCLYWGTAWRTDGRVGVSEAEPGASLGSKFLLGCLTQLGQGLGCMCSGTSSPLWGWRKKRTKKGWGRPVVTRGCCMGSMGAYPTTWLGPVLCAVSEATFTHSGEAVSPTAPSLHLSSGFSELSASAVPEGVCPSCCRASPPHLASKRGSFHRRLIKVSHFYSHS